MLRENGASPFYDAMFGFFSSANSEPDHTCESMWRKNQQKQTLSFDMQQGQKVHSRHLLREGKPNTWRFPDQEGRSGKSQGVLGWIHLDVRSTETPRLPEDCFQEERIELNARGSYRGEEGLCCFNKRNMTIREGRGAFSLFKLDLNRKQPKIWTCLYPFPK